MTVLCSDTLAAGAWFFCRIVVAMFSRVLPVAAGSAAIVVMAGSACLVQSVEVGVDQARENGLAM